MINDDKGEVMAKMKKFKNQNNWLIALVKFSFRSYKHIVAVTREKSDGGKKVTRDEVENLLAEIVADLVDCLDSVFDDIIGGK
jgi:hypothetical protein